MGFFLSIVYFVTYYLAPDTVFGPLAAYRIELILASLALLASAPRLSGSFIFKTPQSLALIGLAFAVILSVAIGMHWPGASLQAFLLFIPNAFAYFLVCLHCDSKKKLQIIVMMLLFVCLFVIVHGSIELRQLPEVSRPNQVVDAVGSYLIGMTNDSGETFYRLRGLGEINDPNDFAQLIVCVIPLVFFFWRPKKTFQNTFFVILPASTLLYGAFLTHSRGSMLAILAMVIMAARRRIGTLPALVIAVGLFVTASALHFTGGREISADSGSDRTALWGEGLQMLKSHPLFGVGFNNFSDYAGLTAHNSVVVCAAELGSFGLYFWALFLFPTVRDALAISAPANMSEGEPPAFAEGLFPQAVKRIEPIDKIEISRLARLLLLSLTGFLVAGWFLSRAFVMTLFLLGSMTEVVYEMALRQCMISSRLPLMRLMRYAGGLAISLLLLMYLMLRTANLMR